MSKEIGDDFCHKELKGKLAEMAKMQQGSKYL